MKKQEIIMRFKSLEERADAQLTKIDGLICIVIIMGLIFSLLLLGVI